MSNSARAHDAASLLDRLKEQAALFQEWLGLEEQRNAALKGRDHDELQEITESQTKLLVRLDALEHARRALARQLAKSESDPTLQQVAAALPSELSELFLEQAERLKALIAQVQEANRRTEDLLRLAAAHNQAMLNALTGGGSAPVTYAPPGSEQAGASETAALRTYRIDRQA